MLLRILDVEPFPQIGSVGTKVAKDRPGVVEFVRERDKDRVLRGLVEVCDVALFALAPRWLRCLERVAAFRDDLGHLLPEPRLDRGESGLAPLIFGGVVKQSGDRLCLASVCLDDRAVGCFSWR